MIKRPMKGEQVTDLSQLVFPKLAFPKVDGFRCLLGSTPLTSQLKPFPNRSFIKEASNLLPEDCMLDSEVTVGPNRGEGVLGRTSSGLTSMEGNPDWYIWVFDMPSLPKDLRFQTRFERAADMVFSLDHPRIRLLRPSMIHDREQLEKYIEKQLRRGFEGVMTRDPEGPYKEGKSTVKQGWLSKIKPFVDFEVMIMGYYEEEENTNEAKREATGKLKRSSAKAGKVGKGTLGGFIGIELETGKEVRVGGGFTKQQRQSFWNIRDKLVRERTVITCSKQEIGEKDKPRHSSFLRLRPLWDVLV